MSDILPTMIDKAKNIYALAGGDFHKQLGWHLVHGFVISIPVAFCMGYWCVKGKEQVAVPLEEANCLCMTYLCGSMKDGLELLVDHVPYVTFQREIKGDPRFRTYNFKQLYSKI
jgi:hypothetical protein